MAQRRILLVLFLIALYQTTLQISISNRLRRYAFDNEGIFEERIHIWAIYNASLYLLTAFLIILILFALAKARPTPELTNIYARTFWIDLLKHLGAYLVGYLTLRIVILLHYNFTGKSFDRTNELYGDILNPFGLLDTNFSLSFPLEPVEGQILYILSGFLNGIFSAIIPILVLIITNMAHSQSAINGSDEGLYPSNN
ncbi:MAG: hypothetical protein ACW99A_23400 [Candidatus Kariarchaeaceae archaeon]|jgi:hypothetical protein